MNQQDETRISELMCDTIGGRTPWIVLWEDGGGDQAGSGVLSNVPPGDVPELLCVYLLKALRGEMNAPEIVVREQ